MSAKGRYFQFKIKAERWAVVSEIELYGVGCVASKDRSFAVAPEENFRNNILYRKAKNRLDIDAARFYELHNIRYEFTDFQLPENVILPINATHQDLFLNHAKQLNRKGFNGLQIWKKHRYYNLQPLEIPNFDEKLELNFSPCYNWVANDALVVTNSSLQDIQVVVTAPENVKIYRTEFTDTINNIDIADWLKDESTFTLKPVMSQKIWVQISNLKESRKLEININGTKIPMNVEVVPIKTPNYIETMSWDYDDNELVQDFFSIPSNAHKFNNTRGKYIYLFTPYLSPEKAIDMILASGIEQSRILWHPTDESSKKEDFERIKESYLYKQKLAPNVKLFANPVHAKELVEHYKNYFDVIVPHPYELELLLPNKLRGLYNWSGQNSFSHPELTFRLMPILEAKNDCQIVGWWLRDKQDILQAYTNNSPNYQIWWNDGSSIHLEAIREGKQEGDLLRLYPSIDIENLLPKDNPNHEWKGNPFLFDAFAEKLKSDIIKNGKFK